MVRYERNQYFTGRGKFLKELFKYFQDSTNSPYRHRIALFGLGGIGKTQVALEYVYRYQSWYSRIYWISADSQKSLLEGYEQIAERAKLLIPSDSEAIDIADCVISWLMQEQRWLIVIDNLDDISVLSTRNLSRADVVATLLPPTGPHQHTLITTRNRYADGIPAQGLEVLKFDEDEALALLSTISKIPIPNDSTDSMEQKSAQQIVESLDFLPLAIEQAAAYIKEVVWKFSTFLNDYAQYRQDLHKWEPQGLREYPHTVATTWRMSFDIIHKKNPHAAQLLQLLSFLNPDGVLIDFLFSGLEALREDLRQLLSHRIEFHKAIIILENFSFVKRGRQAENYEILLIHRLVQTVVKDEMEDAELNAFRTMTVDICNESFPEEWSNVEKRATCRLYVGQVMGPLISLEVIRTEKSASIMYRVGWFLREDGKISDSERLSLRAVKIITEILGDDHPSTLTSMNNLALTYGDQGRTGEAAMMQEEVLQKRRRILGDDHPSTLTSMSNLALTYRDQGRTGEAAVLQEEVLQKRRRILGDDHPSTLTSMSNLALTYRDQGRTGEAAALLEGMWILEEKNAQDWQDS